MWITSYPCNLSQCSGTPWDGITGAPAWRWTRPSTWRQLIFGLATPLFGRELFTHRKLRFFVQLTINICQHTQRRNVTKVLHTITRDSPCPSYPVLLLRLAI